MRSPFHGVTGVLTTALVVDDAARCRYFTSYRVDGATRSWHILLRRHSSMIRNWRVVVMAHTLAVQWRGREPEKSSSGAVVPRKWEIA